MRVLVSGASGLVGSALCAALAGAGHDVAPLVRGTPAPGAVAWDPEAGTVDEAGLAGADALVHLAGAGIGDRRWTPARKAELVASRVDGTNTLVDALLRTEHRLSVFVCASAVGYYGSRADEELTEQSAPGDDFLARLCVHWEEAAHRAEAAGIRVVTLRSGIVLSAKGGALARQLPLFRAGLGGRLGSGRQWVSWVSIDDEVRAIEWALRNPSVRGPLNAVAPNPARNREFTTALARALGRPALLAVPAPALRLALGRELTDTAVLASQRVRPDVLHAGGFEFRHPTLAGAFAALL